MSNIIDAFRHFLRENMINLFVSFYILRRSTVVVLYNTNSGCGKREAHKSWSMVTPAKLAPVTETTSRTTGPVLADSRQ